MYSESQYNQNQPELQSEDKLSRCKKISKRWEALDKSASNWKNHWQDCYDYIVPRKDNIIKETTPGIKKNQDLYDTTAILSNEMLASALHGMLTNPETQFFDITFGDPALDEDESVRNWAQDVSKRMFRVLNNSNFQTEIYETYIDLGAIGTSCLYMGEHDENTVHFSARFMKEVRIDENSLGLIDVVYRRYKLRAHQIVEEFGEKNVPGKILKMADQGSQEEMYILHAVEPMGDKKDARGFAYSSTYMLERPQFILSESGYREFPYAVPRWAKTSGEIYGRGPGMSMLPDIMMVNAMMLTVIQGAQKTVDPPIVVEDDGVIGVVRLTPGGLTIRRPGTQPLTPLITNARVDFGQQVVEDVRNRIRAGFYVDQLKLREGPQMTAEEVRQRVEETLRLMGPVLGRQHFELLRPLIGRLFAIMSRKKMLPPAPAKIQGKDFDVRYSSLIARAQRMSEAQNIARAFTLLQPLATVKRDVVDNFNFDRIVHEVWNIYGLKHDLLLTTRELQEKRKAQAAALAQAQQQQTDMHNADVAQKTAPMVAAMNQGKVNVPQA